MVEAGWVLPVVPADARVDHAVVVDGNRIVAVAPTAEVRAAYRAERTLTLPDHALLPGFVNAHTHAAMTLLRGLADDLPMRVWLQDHIWPAEGRLVSPDFCAAGVRLAVAEMIRGGITCFADQYFFPRTTVEVAHAAGIRAVVGVPVLDFPTPWASGADACIDAGLAVVADHDGLDTMSFAFAPHAPYSVGDAALERLVELSRDRGIRLQMHVHETASEVEEAVRDHGRRPLARLEALGVLGRPFTAIHMTQLTPDEIALCAERGVGVVHCPESNLKLASGFCPVAGLLAAGVEVAVGTDGSASNNDLDMLGELRTAALLAKGVTGDASAFAAPVALRAATRGGAAVHGLADRVGTLEVGKAADFIAVDLGQVDSRPVYDPVSQIVYATGRDRVSHTWVAGQALMEDRVLLTLDPDELRADAEAWGARVAAGVVATG